MADAVAIVSFSGVNGTGIIQMATAGIVKAGDRFSFATVVGGYSDPALFGGVAPADNIIVQTSDLDLSTSRFVALVMR